MPLWEIVTVSNTTTRYRVEAPTAAEAQHKVLTGDLTEEELMAVADLGTDAEEVIDIKLRSELPPGAVRHMIGADD